MIAEIGVPDDVSLDVVVERIESCIAAVSLNVTLKGTLATYPGSIHWHTKRGKEPGVLEITLWPERRRLWFSVHRNRTAPWIEETKVQLKQAIASSLAAVKTRNDSAAFLEADDFFLRSWEIEDAGWYVKSRDEAVFQWTTEKRDLTVAQTEAVIRQLNSNADAFSFAVVDSKSKTILGNIALVLEENDRSVGEIMYWLAPWGRGRGMAKMADTNQKLRNNLRQSYDRKAEERDARTIQAWKLAERQVFLSLLRQEQKQALLEIGAGTGIDGKFFQEQGLQVVCTDLSPEMVKLCRQKGLTAYVMDFGDLHFPPASFEAIYALNSLLHVPKDELPAVLRAIELRLKPGGLFYMGVYGGYDYEGTWQDDSYEPKRFFSFYPDEALQAVVREVFNVHSFKRIAYNGKDAKLHFQSFLLRKP